MAVKGYQASKKYNKESLWDTDFTSMGLKTAIRRLCKYLPKSPELATALVIDDQAGRQKFILDDVINGSYTPVIDEETGEILGQDGNGEVTDVASQSKAPETVIIGGVTATRTKVNEGVTAFVMDPARQPQQPMTKIEKLDKVVAAMRVANTLEVLDEIYVRAEGSLDDAQLEVAMREYRKCKDAMDVQGGLI